MWQYPSLPGQEKARAGALCSSPRVLSLSLARAATTRLVGYRRRPYASFPALRQALLRQRAPRYARPFASLPAVRSRAPKA
jgi:hypothetical protein